jgi:hypothetical protein
LTKWCCVFFGVDFGNGAYNMNEASKCCPKPEGRKTMSNKEYNRIYQEYTNAIELRNIMKASVELGLTVDSCRLEEIEAIVDSLTEAKANADIQMIKKVGKSWSKKS